MLSQLEAVSSARGKPAGRGGRGNILANRQNTLAQLGARELEQNLRKKLGRRWKEGDVFGPYELGPVEQQKWMQMKQAGRDRDVFQVMRKSPLSFYKVRCVTMRLSLMLTNECLEFHRLVRIHDRNRADYAFQRDGPETEDAAEGCKGH
jgi:hypothetical protein